MRPPPPGLSPRASLLLVLSTAAAYALADPLPLQPLRTAPRAPLAAHCPPRLTAAPPARTPPRPHPHARRAAYPPPAARRPRHSNKRQLYWEEWGSDWGGEMRAASAEARRRKGAFTPRLTSAAHPAAAASPLPPAPEASPPPRAGEPKRRREEKAHPSRRRKPPPLSAELKAQLEWELAVEARLREKIDKQLGRPSLDELGGWGS